MKKNYSRWRTFPLEYINTAPVLHSYDYGDLTEREGFSFTFNYNTRTNAMLSTCELPLYAKLFKPVAISSPTQKIYKEINYLNYIINFVKHPFAKFSFGAFFSTNILVLLFGQPQSIALQLITKSVFLTPAPLIALSVTYAATLLFAYLSSVKIRTLTAKVDKIISEFNEEEPNIAIRKLYELESQNRIFFSFWFPGNQSLLFNYRFLHGLFYFNSDVFTAGDFEFESALKMAQNKKDEFRCLRKLINSIYKRSCKSKDFNEHDKKIKELIKQVPSNQEFHSEITEKLEQGLKECYDLIDLDKVSTAFKKFATLEFDAFTDELYPHLSIMYYQMEAVLTLAGKYFLGDVNLVSKDEERLTIARHSLLKVQWYIDTYYPEESVAHRFYVLDFERVWARLPVIPHLPNRPFMPAFDGRKVRTIVVPVEKDIPNKHVKIDFESPMLGM